MDLKKLTAAIIIMLVTVCLCSCGGNKEVEYKELHVAVSGSDTSGDGSIEKPYQTIEYAVSQIQPGTTVIVHEGVYDKITLGSDASGSEDAPVIVKAADGETVIVKPIADSDEEDNYGIHMVNVDNITVEGFEVEGGTHGIYYESTSEQGRKTLDNITISNCTVHGIRGVHGIAVYARNDKAAVTNLVMKDCTVFDCECDSSESTVFNGNIDGFEISGNVIHDNNNIGIDMIGFEGTAKHPKSHIIGNKYENDYVRNGICHDNVVYNISAEGNAAYYEDGEYDLCADGIYVDGGQDIEIYNNFIFNCDIGLEVATEHSPDDNELFRVSGIDVHDNIIADCTGWCGICFGGYDRDLGFTEDCTFRNNTLIDNATQIGVQRSSNNEIYDNLLVGGDAGIEFNTDCRLKDMINSFGSNVWSQDVGTAEWEDEEVDAGDFDIEKLFPAETMSKQQIYENRSDVIDGLKSLIDGAGSSFIPDSSFIKIYQSFKEAK